MTFILIALAVLGGLFVAAGVVFENAMRRGTGYEATLVGPSLDGTTTHQLSLRVKPHSPAAKVFGPHGVFVDGFTLYLADDDLGRGSEDGRGGVAHEFAHLLQRHRDFGVPKSARGVVYIRWRFILRNLWWRIGHATGGHDEREAKRYGKAHRLLFPEWRQTRFKFPAEASS